MVSRLGSRGLIGAAYRLVSRLSRMYLIMKHERFNSNALLRPRGALASSGADNWRHIVLLWRPDLLEFVSMI
jgi:hypothetical protein